MRVNADPSPFTLQAIPISNTVYEVRSHHGLVEITVRDESFLSSADEPVRDGLLGPRPFGLYTRSVPRYDR